MISSFMSSSMLFLMSFLNLSLMLSLSFMSSLISFLVRLQPSLQSNPASSNLMAAWSTTVFAKFLSSSSSWGPYNQSAQLFLFLYLRSKKFFNKIFTIFTTESKSSCTNRKWNYPNRKWNYFSYFQTLDQKTFLTKYLPFLPGDP